MVKSRNRTFGFYVLSFGLFCGALTFIAAVIQYFTGINFLNFALSREASIYPFMILGFFILIIFASILSRKCNIIYIDSENIIKFIKFKNILSRRASTYSFEELDGYFTTYIEHLRGFTPFITICIVKKGKIIKKIDSFYYSNYKQIFKHLKDLKFLGHRRISFIEKYFK